eukprot:Rhum_TRINITY_DN5741_c0_g1::Rhum_TRINITY_DN5741_c0_g1_i1::g.18106::m.18106
MSDFNSDNAMPGFPSATDGAVSPSTAARKPVLRIRPASSAGLRAGPAAAAQPSADAASVSARAKRGRGCDDAAHLRCEVSCDSSFGLTPEGSNMSMEDAASPAAATTAAYDGDRVQNKRSKVQEDLITGVKILDDGSFEALTPFKSGVRPTVNKMAVVKKKVKPAVVPVVDSGKQAAAAAPVSSTTTSTSLGGANSISMSKGLEFTDELIASLGAMKI